MRQTVVYVDILIFLNAIIDYFLLLGSSFLCKRKIKELRLVLASVLASLTSLYIFVPKQVFIVDIFIRLLFSVIITVAAFGFKKWKSFFKAFVSFFCVTLLYNGIAVLFWITFKPRAMLINNSVLYINVSAIEMIVFSVIGYVCIRIIQFLAVLGTKSDKIISVEIKNGETRVSSNALVDTGNSLTDIYKGRAVAITDKATANFLIDDLENVPPLLLPYKTVGNEGLIKSYPCELICIGGKEISPVLLAVSDTNFDGDYKVIISPDILEE